MSDLGRQPFQAAAIAPQLGLPPDQMHRRFVGNGNRETARLARPMLGENRQSGALEPGQVSAGGQLAPDLCVIDRYVADDGGAHCRIRGGDGRRRQSFQPTQGLTLLPILIVHTLGGSSAGLEPRSRQGHEDPVRVRRPLGPLLLRPVRRSHRPPVQVADAECEHQPSAAPEALASS